MDRDPMKTLSLAKLHYQIQSKLSRRFPSIVPHPDRRFLLQRARQNDTEANTRTTLSADEAVHLQCLWVVEFYTPSHISALLQGFEKLGWNLPHSSRAASDPARWIQQLRHSSKGWGWLNIGTIHREDTEKRLLQSRSAPLPNDIDYAIAAMHSITSSIACVVMGFVYGENKRTRFEQELRKDRQTYFQNIPTGGYTILTPDAQKARSIRDVRTQLRDEAFKWFRSYLPGLFSSGVLLNEHPVCEFLLLRGTHTASGADNGEPRNPRWFDILDIDDDSHIWDATWLEGLSFTWPLGRGDNSQHQAAIVAREVTFSDEVMERYGGSDRQNIIYYVDRSLNTLVSRWGILGMLAGYERSINIMRDTMAPTSAELVKSTKVLGKVRSHLVSSIDITTMSSGLQKFVENGATYKFEMGDFNARKPFFPKGKVVSLTDILRQETSDRIARLHQMERTLRDVLVQYSNIISAQENIKLQKRMTFLSWAVVALTIVMVGLAAVSALVSLSAEKLVLP